MGKRMHGSTYLGNSEIKGGRALSFLSVVGKQHINQNPATSLLIPAHYVMSLSLSVPIRKMGIRMLPGEESVAYKIPSCSGNKLLHSYRLAG